MKAWATFLFFAVIVMVAWYSQLFRSPSSVENTINEQLLSNEARLESLQRKVPQETPELVPPKLENRDLADEILDWLVAGKVEPALESYRENLSELANVSELSAGIVAALMREERYKEAIDLLYEQRLFVPFDREEELLNKIHQEVARVQEVLESNQDVQRLISFFEQLIYLEADYPPYYLRLAYWQIQQGDFAGAEQSMQSARHDIRYEEEIAELDALLANEDQKTESPNAVPLSQKGDHFAVDVSVEGVAIARLMIDTGASMTVIKTELLQSINQEFEASGEVLELMTANGKVTGSKVVVSELGLGDQVLSNVDIVSIPLEGFEYDGLLGMNVLSQFEFHIDQAQSVLYLR